MQTLEYAMDHGMDIGAELSLESYNSDRYLANHVLMGVVDKLHKVFAVEEGPLVKMRGWGFRAVDGVGAVKGFLMGQAAGMGGRFV